MSRKIDKGFQLIYWNLTYRRRFIRNLWFLPALIILIGFLLFSGDKIFLNRIYPMALLIMCIFELIYNYTKWKRYEQS